VDSTEVEGPGKRFAVWLQGCSILCPGYCNPQILDFVPRRIIDSHNLLRDIEISHASHGIEGVTFLGGEPMLQARGLSEVARGCRERALSVMVFTGFRLEHLQNNPMVGVSELLEATDLLVDGPYVESRPDTTRNWIGSLNQRFHYLTNRYSKSIETDKRYSRGMEIRVATDGAMSVNGWPYSITTS
jgi:anaerobic ribonucleoside-triphosphate reductase activating protein